MPKRPLKFRELLDKLQPFGIVVMAKRGKGSEVILLKPDPPGSKQGPRKFPSNVTKPEPRYTSRLSMPCSDVLASIRTRSGIDPAESDFLIRPGNFVQNRNGEGPIFQARTQIHFRK